MEGKEPKRNKRGQTNRGAENTGGRAGGSNEQERASYVLIK